jgi:large subunit ribosomal protein L15
MKQNELRAPEGARHNRKRVGRGYGSGHVKTSGRGQKGQKARTGAHIRIGFEGGQNPLIYRMPFKRGFTNPFKKEYHVINVADLAGVPAGAVLTPDSLVELGLVKPDRAAVQEFRVKLLGDGEVTAPYTVRVHKVSAGARQKLEAAGGTVEELA